MTSSGHAEIGPELRALAQTILDRLDPAVRAAAAMATETLRGPGRCQQVWCPVCALAALAGGEQHPMLTVIAEHSVTLVAMLREMVAEPSPADSEAAPEGPPASTTDSAVRYQPIPIVVETVTPESVSPESVSDETVSADD